MQKSHLKQPQINLKDYQMEKLYINKTSANNKLSIKFMAFVVLFFGGLINSYSQVAVDFEPRTSVYTVKGDFTMIGNTNLTLVNYNDNSTNDADMRYVDEDGNTATWNSSSSTLTFSTENGASPECSKVLFAGLYWFGRANVGNDDNADGDNNPNTFSITKGSETKNFDKTKILLNGPGTSGYEEIQANVVSGNDEIYFPSGVDQNLYTAYADITNYVNDTNKGGINGGLGEYFVADIALREGNQDVNGFSGGWGMVIVYENSKMNWRDVTVFDGHAFVSGNNGSQTFSFDVDGFTATAFGDVNVKLGVMASEGERRWTSDYLEIEVQDTGAYQRLTVSGTNNSTSNFFTSSILTHSTPGMRTPELYNNTGVDILMFDIPNTGNSIIDNGQTETSFRYGSGQDGFAIFNLAFSVDAYVPEPVGVLTNTSINGNTSPPSLILEPGGYADFRIELTNTGTEAITGTKLVIPVPESVDPSTIVITSDTNYTPLINYFPPSYNATTKAIEWNLGEIPLPNDPSDVLAWITFKLVATTDCSILSNTTFEPSITMNGSISGTGKTSLIDFNTVLIQGYETTGSSCDGEPIPAPIIVGVDHLDYINTPPTADTPAPINVECAGDVPVSDISVVTNVTTKSGLPATILFVSDTSNGNTCPEIITRRYSVEDDCGNIIFVDQIITISDNTAPIAPSAPATANYQCLADVPAPGDLTAVDNCQGDITVTGTDSTNNTDPCNVVITRTWTFTDACNNASSISQTINVSDNTAPIAPSAPATANYQCLADVPAPGDLTAVDNCQGDITVTGTDSTNNTDPCNVVITRTWTFTDACNNASSVSQTINVSDNTAPIAPSAPATANYQCLADVPAPGDLTAVDNCQGNITVTGTDSTNNTDPCNVVITRTWTFTDACNNASSVSQTINVSDSTAPTGTAPIGVTGADVCAANAQANYPFIPAVVGANYTDNCNAAVIVNLTNTAQVGDDCGWQLRYTYEVIDACGNTLENESITHTGQDQTAPTGTAPIGVTDADVCAANAQTNFPFSPLAVRANYTDNCNTSVIVNLTNTTQSGDDCGWTLTYTYEVLDGCGNKLGNEESITYTGKDQTPPTISCPTNINVQADPGQPNANISIGLPSISDNCDINLSFTNDYTNSENASGTYNLGTTTVTYTATDSCGNSSQCSFTVTVNDEEAPEINCPPTINVTCTNLVPSEYGNYNEFIAAGGSINDNSGIDQSSFALVSQSSDNNTCPETISRVYTISDNDGNSSECTQLIIVNDEIAPVIDNTAGDLDANLECSDAAGISAALALVPTATDDCTTPTINVVSDDTTVDPTCANAYVQVRVWNFTDGCGNTSPNFTQTITVVDTTAPVIDNTAGDLDANLECSDAAGISAALALVPTATDNCATPTINVVSDDTTVDPTCANAYVQVRVWNFTDGCGNTSPNFTQTITVVDTTAPVIDNTAGDLDANVECSDAAGISAALALVPTATDNCTTPTINVVSDDTTVDPTCANAYVQVRVWNFTDDCGNTSPNFTQTITVIDSTAPVIANTAGDLDANVECSDAAGISAALALVPTATDNCTTPTINVVSDDTTVDPTCANAYVQVRVWNFTDDCGTTSPNFTQTITVVDTTAPVIDNTAGDLDATVECSDAAGISAALALVPTATDNCTTPTINVVSDDTTVDPTCANAYVQVRVWNFTDGCGNTSPNFTQTITVVDTTAPVIDNTAGDLDANVECSDAARISAALALVPTATDNCTTPAINVVSDDTTVDPICPNAYVQVRVWNFTDGCGNTSPNFTQTITVVDTTAPVIDNTNTDNIEIECGIGDTQAQITAWLSNNAGATATDNCGSVTWTNDYGSDSSVKCDNGAITVTFTATDACNNFSTTTATYLVKDNTPPVVDNTPGDLDATLECSDTTGISAALALVPTATDDCSAAAINIVSDDTTIDPTCANAYVQVRVWNFTDGCGNTSPNFTQTITVVDTTAPVIDNTAGDLDANLECSDAAGISAALALAPTATDNCTTPIINVVSDDTTVDPTCANAYVQVRVWNFTDGCGNTSPNFTQTITVVDTTAPVIDNTAGDLDANLECSDAAGISAALALIPTATDNCTTPTINVVSDDTTVDPICANAYVQVRVWNFTDDCGNTSPNFTQTITVVDTTAPVIDNTNTDNIEIECGIGDTQALLTNWLSTNAGATAADNCGSVTWTNDYGSDTSVKCDNGAITVTFTATDNCNNFSTTTATYLIKDNTPPAIDNTPGDLDATLECSDATGISDALALEPTAIDDCSTATINIVSDDTTIDPACANAYVQVRVWNFTDGCGNISDNFTQTITVVNTTAPVIDNTAGDLDATLECSDAAGISDALALAPTATDNCATPTINMVSDDTTVDPDCLNAYVQVRVWNFTDGCGNTSPNFTQTITVVDTTAPELTLPANATAECSDDLSPIDFGTATATDNCDASPAVSYEDVRTDGPCSGTYTIIRTWTATDACGNTVSADQSISTSDTTAPTFDQTDLPSDVVVECAAVPDQETLTATDNCGDAIVTVEDIRTDGNCNSNYVITRTYTATDDCGLTNTHVQTITVQDTTPPTFVETLPPANIIVECDDIPVAETLTATDDCDTATVSVSDTRTDGNCENNYTLARTWTATDECGNTSVHTQIITVQDTTAPEFVETLPRDVTVECDDIPEVADITATDNCGDAVVTAVDVITDGDCPSNYSIARTWTATDECGLTNTYTQIITVQDTTAPVPTTTFEAEVDASCTDIPDVPDLEFADNCSTNVIVDFEEINSFDDTILQDYQIIRTWTVRDACNNEEVYTQTINVTLDEIYTEVVAEDRCFEEGVVNLNDLLPSTLNTDGDWEMIEGNTDAPLTGSIFDPTQLKLTEDFLPGDGGIDYVFKYTTTDMGCISITEIIMNVHADCVVLPCGENDIKISKAITPNGDGYNDTFDIAGIDLCGFVAEIKVFNRWGALVYESNNYTLGSIETSGAKGDWDGSSPNSSIGASGKLPTGTYYYIINLKNSGLSPLTGPVYLGTK
jgi:gliding motility-associated-like protein